MAGNADNFDEELAKKDLQTKEDPNETPVMQDGEQVGVQQDPQVSLDATPEKNSSDMSDALASYDPDAEAAQLYPKASDDSQSQDDNTSGSSNDQADGTQSPTPVATMQDVKATEGKTPADIRAYLMKKYNIGNAFDDQALQDAQKNQDARTLAANISEGAATIASGLTGQGGKIDSAYYDKLRQQAGSQVADIQQRQKNMMERLGFDQKAADNFITQLNAANTADENDPNSPTKWALVNAMKQQAPKLYAQLPADEIQALTTGKIKAFFADYIKREDDQTARHEDIATKVEANRLQKEQNQIQKDKMNDIQQNRYDDKIQAQIGSKLNTLDASSRKVLGVMAGNVRAADSVIELMGRKDLTPQDLNGLAAPDMNRLVTGQVSVAGAQANEYNTLKTKAAELWGKITSSPTSADMPDVRQHLASIAKQMQDISNKGIDQNTKFVGSQYSRWINESPDHRNAFLDMASNVYGATPTTPTATAPQSTTGSSSSNNPSTTNASAALAPNEVLRKTSDGKAAIFDKDTKQFLRYQ